VKLLNRRTPKVLLYHEISKGEEETLLVSEISMAKSVFLKQINFLLSHYTVVSLEDIENGVGVERVAITFDDGFRSVLTNAIPILTAKGIHCTVFLITPCCSGDFILGRHAEMMHAAIGKREVRKNGGSTNDRSLHAIMRYGEGESQDANEYSSSRFSRSNIYISWQDIANLDCASYVDWQSHTHSHYDLSKTDLKLVVEDVSISIEDIFSNTGSGVRRLALPFGKMPRDFNEFLKKMIALGIEGVYLADGTSRHKRFWLHDGSIWVIDRIQLRGSSNYQLFTELEILPHLRAIFNNFYKDS